MTLTRRRALARIGLSVAAPATALGAGSASVLAAQDALAAAPAADEDAGILAGVIAAERACEAAYSAALAAEALPAPGAALFRLLREQERAHLAALGAALRRLGEEVPAPPGAAVPPALRSPSPGPAGMKAAARAAIGLENAAVVAQVAALRRLAGPALIALLGPILSSDAQHLVLLREAAGAGPAEAVPDAFEAGVSPPPGSGGGGP
ncbi:MAG: ferritin-like domain-containing protein [Solirubrobacterales bacterium]